MDNDNNEEDKDVCHKTSGKWKEFLENTTLHGIRNVVSTEKPFLRMLWSILLLTSGSYYIFTVYGAFQKYFSFPVATTITRKYVKNMTFPAVSICPNNVFSRAKVMTWDDDPEFAAQGLNLSACAATKDLRQKQMDNMPCGLAMMCCCTYIGYEYDATTIHNCTAERRNDLREAVEKSAVNFNMENFFRYYSQDFNAKLGDISFCTFGWTQTCSRSDFYPVITETGFCYTYNSGESNRSLIIASSSGIANGLNMLLDINDKDHTIGKLSQGFSISIHTQGEFFTELDGFKVSPGTFASIGVSEQRVR